MDARITCPGFYRLSGGGIAEAVGLSKCGLWAGVLFSSRKPVAWTPDGVTHDGMVRNRREFLPTDVVSFIGTELTIPDSLGWWWYDNCMIGERPSFLRRMPVYVGSHLRVRCADVGIDVDSASININGESWISVDKAPGVWGPKVEKWDGGAWGNDD